MSKTKPVSKIVVSTNPSSADTLSPSLDELVVDSPDEPAPVVSIRRSVGQIIGLNTTQPVQALDDVTAARVTRVDDRGGRLLRNVEVVLIYWGTYWNTAHGAEPTVAQLNDATTRMLAGNYLEKLAQYRGVNGGNLVFNGIYTATNPSTTFRDSDIETVVGNALGSMAGIPQPAASRDLFYAVLLPPGVSSSQDTGAVGKHGKFSRRGLDVIYTWIMNDGTLTGFNSIPATFSHELVEACTDATFDGIIVFEGDAAEEIGDVCSTVRVVDGVAVQDYWSRDEGACVLPDHHYQANPVLIQSRFGRKGNFEFVEPLQAGGLGFKWRENDNGSFPWHGPFTILPELGRVDGLTMIQSNFGAPGNLELIARVGDRLRFAWRESGPALRWSAVFPLIADGREVTGVTGNPVLIQSRFGRQGNFELVVPRAEGGLAFYWRDNDNPALPWHGPAIVAPGVGRVDAVTLIQSNFGTGNLEVVVRVGDRLKFLWRDGSPSFGWHGPFPLIADGHEVTGVVGNPVLIQSHFGRQGNFELAVPLAGGGVAFLWRNNDDPAFPWHGPFAIGTVMARADAVTLIQSNFGVPGNLELIARTGTSLRFMWRDSGPAFNWSVPVKM